MKNLLTTIYKNLLIGFLTLVPLIIGIWIFSYIYNYIFLFIKFFFGNVNSLALNFFLFFSSLLLIYLVGYQVNRLKKVFILSSFENLLIKLPFIGFVLKTVKQLIYMFFSEDNNEKYLGVVKVPFNNGKTLGLITNISENKDEYTVFVPTAPNPTSGFVMYYKKDEIELLEMDAGEVFKIQISLGIK